MVGRGVDYAQNMTRYCNIVWRVDSIERWPKQTRKVLEQNVREINNKRNKNYIFVIFLVIKIIK